MRKDYRSFQTPQPYFEKLVFYASKPFILHLINIGLMHSQVEQISRQMRHLTTLNMSLVCCMVNLIRLAYLILQIQTMDVTVFIRTRQLRTLWEDSRERMENFVRSSFLILAAWY